MNDLHEYDRYRGLIDSGDMLEFCASTFLGGAIRLFTGKNVNHTAFVISLDNYLGMSEHHKFILEANADGIELGLLSRVLENFDGKVYLSRLKPEYNHLRLEMARWAVMQTGIGYDYGSLFKNMVSKVSADARKMFCSEFYYLALKHVGIVKGNKSPRPGEFGPFNLHEPPIRIL